MIFAKLFNLNDSDQLLVKRFYDTDTEMYVLSLETDLDDLIVKMEMRMSTLNRQWFPVIEAFVMQLQWPFNYRTTTVLGDVNQPVVLRNFFRLNQPGGADIVEEIWPFLRFTVLFFVAVTVEVGPADFDFIFPGHAIGIHRPVIGLPFVHKASRHLKRETPDVEPVGQVKYDVFLSQCVQLYGCFQIAPGKKTACIFR